MESRFRTRLLHSVSQAKKFKNHQAQFLFSSVFSIEFLSAFLYRQQKYLLWAFYLVGTQVLEIFILAKAHLVFFSPESLFVLRLLSSFTLVGVVGAIAVRRVIIEKRSEDDYGEHDAASTVKTLAHVLFLATAALTLIISLYVLYGTNLTLSSAPMFRAVIIAGLCALPFDTLTTFLFYNRSTLGAPPPSRRIRYWFFGFSILALLSLFSSYPLLYLFLKLTPRVITAFYLWSSFTRLSLQELLGFSFISNSARIAMVDTFKRIGPACGLLAAQEVSFFLVTAPLVSSFEWAGLTIYFAHKMIHTASMIGFKGALPLVRWRTLAQRLCDKTLQHDFSFKLFVTTVFSAFLSFVILPPLLARNWLFIYASPTGEFDTFNPILIPALAIFVFAHSWFIVFNGVSAIEGYSRFGEVARMAAAIVLPSVLCRSILYLIYFGEENLVFTLTAFLDGALLLALSGIGRKPRVIASVRTFAPFLPSEKTHSHVLLLYFVSHTNIPDVLITHLSEKLPCSKDRILASRWSERVFFGEIVLPEQLSPRSFVQDLIDAHGIFIDHIRWREVRSSLNLGDIRELFRKDCSLGDTLLAARSSRRVPKDAPSPAACMSAAALKETLLVPYQKGWRVLEPGILYLTRSPSGWELPRTLGELDEKALLYLERAIEGSIGNLCSYSRSRRLQGFCHLNQQGIPAVIVFCSQEKRHVLYDIRRLLLAHNIEDLVVQSEAVLRTQESHALTLQQRRA